MVAYRVLFLAGAVAAVPLNINLGAYSPAVVVGDGEISFGGNSDVTGLMSVLQGAAVNAANGAATQGGGKAPEAAPAAQPAPAAAPARIIGGAAEPMGSGSAAQAGTEAGTTIGSQVANAVADQAQQIAALQGMGKAVLPRGEVEEAETTTSGLAKRDMAGFDRALKFAEAALVKGPKIQLGTGREGSGVGIIVENSPSKAGGEAAAAATKGGRARAKRDLPGNPRVKVTTMYVRSGIPSALMSEEQLRARSPAEGGAAEPHVETIQIAPAKRDLNSPASANAIDAVNLNVSGDQGVTLTFVETIDGDGDDSEL